MRRGFSAFSCVQTEGGILPADLLVRISEGDKAVPGLTGEDYHLIGNETFGEAINRSWSRLRGAWKSFTTAVEKLPEGDLATRVTREKWLLPLFQELGYGRLTPTKAVELEGRIFAISHQWKSSPIHLLGCGISIDRKIKGVAGAAMASPHGLIQDFLNRSENHLWGFVSNGYALRILRDNYSLTRQAYVDFDLHAMMEGEQYAEFSLLWMICHESRVEADKPEECWLEKWFQFSKEQGVRALDKLRDGVKSAIEHLGAGFLRQRQNQELREKLSNGEWDLQDYYRQLLRLVYRLIFLFAAEERGALLDPNATEEAKRRYLEWYGTSKIRRLAEKRRGTPHVDLWQGLRLVMAKLQDGCPELGLPALGSFLWSETACPWLTEADIANEDLLGAFRALTTTTDGKMRQPVNWKLVGAAELGSVYESLLELHPKMEKDATNREDIFRLDTAAGHERKTTGSYYTPSSLVDCLLDSALEPVMAEAAKKPNPEQAILDLKVCDPACGSGHFLVAAARRIAKRLAQARCGDEEPSPGEMQRALRDVVGRCLFGVDLNPMAVELCKVSLWMEALEPGKPLSFLDGHILVGNSLLGTTPALMEKGIPDEAFNPIEGDDKKIASALKKQNKEERKGEQIDLFAAMAAEAPAKYDVIVGRAEAVEQKEDSSIDTVRCKERAWKSLVASDEYSHATFLADAWCAAFVWPKTKEHRDSAVTEDMWIRMKAGPAKVPVRTRGMVERLRAEYAFFHWHLAFPQVFRGKEKNEATGWSGGFDCVLGNPPWERIKIQEQEFFASRSSDIATAANAAARKKLIAALPHTDTALWDAWCEASRRAQGESVLVRSSMRFPLCGRGDVNTYSVFAELNRSLISPIGCVGCILPPGIVTDDTTKYFFQSLVKCKQLASVFEFENEEFLFPGIDHRVRFVLLFLSGINKQTEKSLLSFANRRVDQIHDDGRFFTLSSSDFTLLNPNTHTCPIFRFKRDAEITKGIYHRVPVLIREAQNGEPEENPWGLSFMAMLHMANDSGLFRTRDQLEAFGFQLSGNIFKQNDEQLLPLYEAKMIHHFDHRFGTYDGQTQAQENQGKLPETTPEQHDDPAFLTLPRYWIAESEVENRLRDRWDRGWLLGWRRICRSTDARTFIASLFPLAGVGDSFFLMLADIAAPSIAAMYANLVSFPFDYNLRQKMGGTNASYHIIRQLPVFDLRFYNASSSWVAGKTLTGWLLPRVLELTYTAWDLEPFAKDCGYDGPPFRWDEERRFLLRCELDAAFFHLYGIVRDDVDYIMETFPIVKRKDVAAHGSYRTKEKILEIYDALQRAIDSGEPYQTVIDPPPADPRVAHPAREAKEVTVPVPAVAAKAPLLPDIAALADGAWATPPGVTLENVSLFSLISVLSKLTGPVESEKVRMASILVRKPVLALPFFNRQAQAHWKRVVGREAQPLPANVVSLDQFRGEVPDMAWASAMQQLKGSGALVEDIETGLWSAGDNLPHSSEQEWIEGRAAWAVELLKEIEVADAEQNIVSFLRSVHDGSATGAVS